MSRNPVKIATTHRFPQTGLVLHGVPTGVDSFFRTYSCTSHMLRLFCTSSSCVVVSEVVRYVCKSVYVRMHLPTAATPVPDPIVLGNAETLVHWLTLPSFTIWMQTATVLPHISGFVWGELELCLFSMQFALTVLKLICSYIQFLLVPTVSVSLLWVKFCDHSLLFEYCNFAHSRLFVFLGDFVCQVSCFRSKDATLRVL